MIHLDTHVAIWLFDRRLDSFPAPIQALIDASRPIVSPMVRLELTLLHEIGRITVPAAVVLDGLRIHADLGVAESRFERVSAIAATLSWTRDPFDRLIAAHALADDLPLITKDRAMLEHCAVARWG